MQRNRPLKGLIQVYTGNGKGKTTAALGLAFRASGHGFRTLVIQFMKGRINYGELKAAKRLGESLTIIQTGRPDFVKKGSPDPIDVALAQAGLALARKAIKQGKYDLIVLDEINCAQDYGLITLEQVLSLIKDKPDHVELILTGRWAHPQVKKLAHLVTEMKEIKHYYRKGIKSRKGFEW